MAAAYFIVDKHRGYKKTSQDTHFTFPLAACG